MLAGGRLAHARLAGRLTTQAIFPAATGEPQPPTSAVTHSAADLDVVAWLHACAGQRGIALPRLAGAWAISNPAVNVAIAGALRALQLDALMPAADADL